MRVVLTETSDGGVTFRRALLEDEEDMASGRVIIEVSGDEFRHFIDTKLAYAWMTQRIEELHCARTKTIQKELNMPEPKDLKIGEEVAFWLTGSPVRRRGKITAFDQNGRPRLQILDVHGQPDDAYSCVTLKDGDYIILDRWEPSCP